METNQDGVVILDRGIMDKLTDDPIKCRSDANISVEVRMRGAWGKNPPLSPAVKG